MGNPSDGCLDLLLPHDLSRLEIRSGDVVVVKTGAEGYEDTAARAVLLRDLFEQHGITDTLILVLSEGTTIESLPEDRMRELGWVRA